MTPMAQMYGNAHTIIQRQGRYLTEIERRQPDRFWPPRGKITANARFSGLDDQMENA